MVSVDREDLAMIDGPFSDASRGLSESLIRELGSVGVAVEQQRPVPAHAFFPPQTHPKGTNQGGLGRRLLQRWEGSARVRLFHDCSERSSIPVHCCCYCFSSTASHLPDYPSLAVTTATPSPTRLHLRLSRGTPASRSLHSLPLARSRKTRESLPNRPGESHTPHLDRTETQPCEANPTIRLRTIP